jgi:hypothetical protein
LIPNTIDMNSAVNRKFWRSHLSHASVRLKKYSGFFPEFSLPSTNQSNQPHYSMVSLHLPSEFTWESIQALAPKSKGVYILYDQEKTPIFYGKAERRNLKVKVALHLESSNASMKKAKYFSFEVTTRPSRRLEQFLKTHKAVYGSLPECNDLLENNPKQVFRGVSSDRSLVYAAS